MTTIWLLVVLCTGVQCGPKGGDIRGMFSTFDECREAALKAAQKQKFKGVCLQGLVENPDNRA